MGKTNPKAGRKPYHHGNLRAALVEAAFQILEDAHQELTIRAVAKAAGVSHTAPYNHFADKEALLAAVAVRGFEKLKAAVEEARRGGGSDPGPQLAATGRAYVHFCVEHPALFRLMFGSRHTDRYAADVRAAGLAAFEALVDVMRDGMKAGVFRDGDPWASAFTAWSLVHGVAQLAIDGIGPLSPEDREGIDAHLRVAHDVMMRGLQRG